MSQTPSFRIDAAGACQEEIDRMRSEVRGMRICDSVSREAVIALNTTRNVHFIGIIPRGGVRDAREHVRR